jgi:hypothetical protein
MNVQIRDPVLFRHLSHLDVRAYLAGQRWTEAGRIGNKATVHTQQDAAHRTWEISSCKFSSDPLIRNHNLWC